MKHLITALVVAALLPASAGAARVHHLFSTPRCTTTSTGNLVCCRYSKWSPKQPVIMASCTIYAKLP